MVRPVLLEKQEKDIISNFNYYVVRPQLLAKT